MLREEFLEELDNSKVQCFLNKCFDIPMCLGVRVMVIKTPNQNAILNPLQRIWQDALVDMIQFKLF